MAGVVKTLREHDAMDYSIVVSASASESAPMLYIAPYAGAAMGEYFMYKGRDVLIICCSTARPDARLIPATCSICTPVCWSGLPASATRRAAAA